MLKKILLLDALTIISVFMAVVFLVQGELIFAGAFIVLVAITALLMTLAISGEVGK